MAKKQVEQTQENTATQTTATFSTDTMYTSGVHIKVRDIEKTYNQPVSINDVLMLASENQIRDFDIYSGNRKITAKDFPLTSGDYVIVPVNKAA